MYLSDISIFTQEIYGGLDVEQNLQSTLYAFNIQSSTWSIVTPSGTAPAARSDHAVVTTGGIMWIVGGAVAIGKSGELWAYNSFDNSWTDFTKGNPLNPAVSGHTAYWTTIGKLQ